MNLAILYLPLLFPAYLVKFSVGGIPFTVPEVMVYVLFLVYLPRLARDFCGWLCREEWDICGETFWRGVWVPIILIVLGVSLPLFWLPREVFLIDGTTVFESQKVALGIWKGWIVAPILYFVMLLGVVKKKQDLARTFDAYAVSAVLLALWGFYQIFSGHYITDDNRVSGPFVSANYLALYIGPAALYLLMKILAPLLKYNSFFKKVGGWIKGFFVSEEKKNLARVERLFHVFALLILFVALMGTQSYGALIGFVCALAVFLILELKANRKIVKKRWFLRVMGGIVILAALIVALLSVVDSEKLSKVVNFTERTSSSVRVEVWMVAAHFIAENPVFGIGAGQFEALYQLNAPMILGHAPYEWIMLHPHNIFLTFWLYGGLLGLVGFLWIVIRAVRVGWRAKGEPLVLFALMMLLMILVHGMFDTPFWKNDLAFLFWLVVGGVEVGRRGA